MRQVRVTQDWIDSMLRKTKSYRELFDSPVGRRVLYDLAKECGAARTTFTEDAREHARLEGRRQIWLYITKMTRMTEHDLHQLLQEGKDYE